MSVVLLAVLAAAIPEKDGNALDQSAEALLGSIRSDGLTSVFKVFSYLGSTIAIAAITLSASLIAGWKNGWRRGAYILIGVAAAFGLNLMIKMWIDRARPSTSWGIEADGASFPSGNAMLAMAMFGLIAWNIIEARGLSRGAKSWSAAIVISLIAMMGLSRVYFHVHYITDILGGYAASMGVISLIMIIHTTYKKRGAVHL